MRIRRLLQIIDAPILAIQEHDDGTRSQPVNIHKPRHTMAQGIVHARLKPVATPERFEVQMLDIIYWRIVKKQVLESFFSILLTGIKLHAFLLVTSRSTAMGAQSRLLVDAPVVMLVKLHVATALPFSALTEIIARPFGYTRRLPCTWDKNSSIIIEQVQGIGTKRHHRQAMSVAAQSVDKIAVGHHRADTLPLLVKYRCANHNAMLHRIGKVELRFKTIVDGVYI